MTNEPSSPDIEHGLIDRLRAGSKLDSSNTRSSRIAMKEAADLIERLRGDAQTSLGLAEAAIERQKAIKPDVDVLAKDLVAAGESEYAAQTAQEPLNCPICAANGWTDPDSCDHTKSERGLAQASPERIAELQYEAGMYKSLYEAAIARSSEDIRQATIEECASVAFGFNAACNSRGMTEFVDAGLVQEVYNRDFAIGNAIRALALSRPNRCRYPACDLINCECGAMPSQDHHAAVSGVKE